jgi:hypothetical protein
MTPVPQAIRLTDPLGRSCLYLPTTRNGKAVDTRLWKARPPRFLDADRFEPNNRQRHLKREDQMDGSEDRERFSGNWSRPRA